MRAAAAGRRSGLHQPAIRWPTSGGDGWPTPPGYAWPILGRLLTPGTRVLRRCRCIGSFAAAPLNSVAERRVRLTLPTLFSRGDCILAPVTGCRRLAVRFKPACAAQGIPACVGHKQDLGQSVAPWTLGWRPAGIPAAEGVRALFEPLPPQRSSRLRHRRKQLQNPVPAREVLASGPAEFGNPGIPRLRGSGRMHSVNLAHVF